MGLEEFYNSLFGKKKTYQEIEDEVNTWKDTPRYKIGMFVKLVINGTIFRNQLCSLFDGDNKENIGDAGEFLMYTRAWNWIKDFDPKDKEWVDDLNSCGEEDTIEALNLAIAYFESIEEFEKCAFLLSIKELLKKA